MKEKTKKVAKTTVKAKGKKAAAVASLPVKAPRKLDISRERMKINTGLLRPAPWNPRGEISPESVADLVSSITTVGIIEPLVVMEPESGKGYIIIAGHRRAKAAALAKCKTVPCDVLRGIDVATAKRMTFIENLQRCDANPILESNLVAELVADGMTTDEIAAEIGRDRKWVLRRKNLTNLSPSWRKRVASGEKITTDCLEHIAAYPEAIQEKLKTLLKNCSGTLHWDDLSWEFKRETCDLSGAAFDTSPCRTCPKNTGCTPDLFDWQNGKPATLGKCMDAKCYKQHLSDFVAKLADKAKAEGTIVYRHEPSMDVDSQSCRDKKHTELYIYTDYNKELRVEWGRPKNRSETSAAADDYQERVAAERKEKRERNKAIRKLAEWCGGGTSGEPCNLATLLSKSVCRSPYTNHASSFAVFAIQHMFDFVGWPTYRLIGTATDIRKCAISAFFGNLSVPDNWTCKVAAEIINSLNPSRGGGWQAERNAVLIIRMLGADAADKVGADIVAAIVPKDAKDDDAEKFRNPQINWLGDDETVSDFDEPDVIDDETGDED